MNALHSREHEKIVSSVWGEEGTVVSSQRRSDRPCEIRKKSGQQRRRGRDGRREQRREEVGGGGGESVSSLKERNGRIGAFPPHGYSTFMT